MAQDKIRTFLGIPFAAPYEGEFRRLLDQFRSYSSEVKWVDPAQVHLTLHFFGSVEPDRIESLKIFFGNLARRFRPFEVYLKEIGAFPNLKQPRVIWTGLAGEIDVLKDLKEAVDLEVVRIGFPIEGREFAPHLTLGRVRERARIQLVIPDPLKNYVCETKYRIHEIILYQSRLTSKGAVYTAIGQFPFQE